MAIRTISDTGGFYNSTASWQEGTVPTSVDDVVSTSTSGPLTVNVFSAAKSIDLSQYANTLTMNNGITISGSFSLGTGFTISGTFGVVVNSSGSLRSYGLTWSNSLTFAGTNMTYTFIDDWVVNSIDFRGASTTILNGKTITASNGLTQNSGAQISGTTKIILTGGTWSHIGAGRISNSVDLSGNINFGTNIYSGGGTISYITGTINSTGNTFNLQTGTLGLVNTNSIDFNNFLVTGSSTINGSNLNLLGNLTINATTTGNSKIVMKGNSIWTSTGYLGNSIDFNAPGNTITLSSNIYYNTGTMSYIAGTVSASSTTLNLFAGGNLALSLGDSISFNSVKTWGVTTTINLGNNLRTTDLWVGPYFTGNWTSTYLTFTGTYSIFVSGLFYFGLDQFNGSTTTPAVTSISISNILYTNNLSIAYGSWNQGLNSGQNPIIVNGGTLSISGGWGNANYAGGAAITGTGTIHVTGTALTSNNRVLGIATNLTIEPQSTLSLSLFGSYLNFSGSNLKYLGGTVSWNNNIIYVASSANITTNSTSKWYYLYFTGGTSTLVNDCNVDILGSGGTVVINSNKFNVNSNLVINGAMSGTSLVLVNGTGSQVWSATSYLNNNLTINKPSGTFSLSGNVYYQSGTFSYVSGSYSTTGGTLNLGTSCKIDSNGLIWTNVTNTATATIDLPNDLIWTGVYSITGGTIGFTGSGSLTASSTGNLLANGSSTVNFKNDIQVINVTLGPTTLNRNVIYVTGNLNTTGNTTGTSSVILMGLGTQTWSSSANAYLSNNLDVNKPSGSLNISGNVYYQAGTFSFTSGGAYSTTGSNLNLGTSCKLNSNNIIWESVTNTATATIDLPVDMRWTGTWSVTGGTLTFTNSGTLTASNTGNFLANGSSTVNLKNDIQIVNATLGPATINRNTINVTGNLRLNGLASGTSSIIVSGTGSQTWSASAVSSYLYNNLTINKSSGTFIVSGNVSYGVGTLTYISGTVSTTGSTLNLNTTTNLNTNGIIWNNLTSWNASSTNLVQSSFTTTLISDFVSNGTFTINQTSVSQILTITGTGSLTVGTFSWYNTAGTNGSTSMNLPNFTYVSNLVTGANGTICYLTLNGGTMSISGGITLGAPYAGIIGGTNLVMTGTGSINCGAGSQASISVSRSTIRANLIINTPGTITLATNLMFSAGTLTYISGTIVQNNNWLYISNGYNQSGGMSVTLNTANLEWWNVYISPIQNGSFPSGSSTVSLLSDLYTKYFTIDANQLTMNNNNFYIANDFSINATTLGTTNFIINGTQSQLWSSGTYLYNNITINKSQGTLTTGANVYYVSGTFSYATGSVNVTTNSTTLQLGGSCNLQTNPIQWVNINNANTGTINLVNNLSFTGTWSANVGVISYTGSGLLTPTASSRINFSGSSAVTVPDSVLGLTMSTISITTNQPTQLRGTISCSGLLTLGGGGSINNASGFTGFIKTGGGLSMTGNASGTATIILQSGTWSATGANYLGNNLRLDGNSTISSNVYYQSGTLSYVGGNVNMTNSTLNLGSSCVVDSNGLTWSNITNTTTATVTLPTNLLWLGTYSVTSGTINFSGVGSLSASTTGNVNFSGSSTINLKNDIQVVNATFNNTTVNSATMSVNGNLLVSNTTSGTARMRLTGGTWSHSAVGFINNNLDLLGDCIITGNVYYGTGVLTSFGGNVTASNSTLNVNGSTLDTKSINFGNVVIASATTVTLRSDFVASTFSNLYAPNAPFPVSFNTSGTFSIYIHSFNFSSIGLPFGDQSVNASGVKFFVNDLNTRYVTGYGPGIGVGLNGAEFFINRNLSIETDTYGSATLSVVGSGDITTSNILPLQPTLISPLVINTLGKVNFSGVFNFSKTSVGTAIFRVVKGNINAKGATFNLQSTGHSHTLFGMNKINWTNVQLPPATTITMDEFFLGRPDNITNINSFSSVTNYNISFTDNFEKIARHVNPSNLTLSRPGQLLIVTDSKRGFSTNRGIRYINSSPNSITKSNNTQLPVIGTFLVNDPSTTKILFSNTLYESLIFTASSAITLTNNGSGNVDMFKTSGGAAWNSQCYSTTPFTAPCTIEFNKQAASGDNLVSYAMIGWNLDPTKDADYQSLDYASYPYRTDIYSVYNNGSQVLFSGVWSTSNKFYIVYDVDGFIRHYNGSTLLYSVNYGTGRSVYVDSSFYSVNSTFGGFSNVRVTRSSWNGTGYTTLSL